MEYWELWDSANLEELFDKLREEHNEEELLFWLAFQSDELKALKTEDPVFRATITPERFWVREWSGELKGRTEVRRRMRDAPAGISVIDLWVAEANGRHDLIAGFLHPREPSEEAVTALIEWGEKTGYAKVFLPDGIAELECSHVGDLVAEVDCPSCGTIFRGEGFDFWGQIVDRGRFPSQCEICGGSLPEAGAALEVY